MFLRVQVCKVLQRTQQAGPRAWTAQSLIGLGLVSARNASALQRWRPCINRSLVKTSELSALSTALPLTPQPSCLQVLVIKPYTERYIYIYMSVSASKSVSLSTSISRSISLQTKFFNPPYGPGKCCGPGPGASWHRSCHAAERAGGCRGGGFDSPKTLEP